MFPVGAAIAPSALKITIKTPIRVAKIANHVLEVVFSLRIKYPSPAAITGAVASAVKTTVIDVSIAAKLKEILLPAVASKMIKKYLLVNFLMSFISKPLARAAHIKIKVKPINRPRQAVKFQLSSPESRISSVSGVMISAPRRAKPIPKLGCLDKGSLNEIKMLFYPIYPYVWVLKKKFIYF